MATLHLRSAKEVQLAFRARGETVSGWAERHGFPRHCVYGVLSGRIKGDRGEGHHVAVALGIKAQPQAPGIAMVQGGQPRISERPEVAAEICEIRPTGEDVPMD